MSEVEHQEQSALFRLAMMHWRKYPELELMFAIPNGSLRHPVVAKKLKAEGVKGGVPDIFLPAARGGYHGLFIEMKTARNKTLRVRQGKASADQIDWVDGLKAAGYEAVVCYGHQDAWRVIVEYLNQNQKDTNGPDDRTH